MMKKNFPIRFFTEYYVYYFINQKNIYGADCTTISD